MVPIGKVDDLEVLIGQRGTGKTSYMQLRALQLRRKYGGAYVIGHSLGKRLTKKLPQELGGQTIPLEYHATIAKLARGVAHYPERWHILAPPLPLEAPPDYYRDKERETADELLAYSVQLSMAIRVRAWRKAHPMSLSRDPLKMDFEGLDAPPIIELVDEGVAVEGAGKSNTKEENRQFDEYLFGLRHAHIALLWSIQDPTARGWRILGQATWLRVFHVKHQYAIEGVRAAGADESQVERVPRLYKYEHVDIRISAEERPRGTVAPVEQTEPTQGVKGERSDQ